MSKFTFKPVGPDAKIRFLPTDVPSFNQHWIKLAPAPVDEMRNAKSLDEHILTLGFKDRAEFNAMVSNVSMETADDRGKFRMWLLLDGSKLGLQSLRTRK